jgi:hypothetical protein
MPKAIRYRSGGKFLENTLFSTVNSDFLGAYHGVPTDAIFDAVLAAEEEALTIASHKVDLGAAFGIDPSLIECVVVPWNGDPATLPKEDEANARVRLPVAPPPPPEPTFEQLVAQAVSFADLKALVMEQGSGA